MPPAFNPLEFMTLGARLATSPAGEAELRTAVGRTYYAVFLTAREKTGVTLTHGAHKEVNRLVKQKLGLGVSSQLKNLERLRNVADYELAPSDPGLSNWGMNFVRAQTIAGHILPKIQAI